MIRVENLDVVFGVPTAPADDREWRPMLQLHTFGAPWNRDALAE